MDNDLYVRRQKAFKELFNDPLNMSVIDEESSDQINDTLMKRSSTTERTKETNAVNMGECESLNITTSKINEKDAQSLIMNISDISHNLNDHSKSSIDLNKDEIDIEDMLNFKNINDQTFIDLNISDKSNPSSD